MVSSIAAASDVIQLHAALCGGTLCTADFLMRGRGPCLKLRPALSLKRTIWMTRAFVGQHAAAARAVIDRSALFSCWKLEAGYPLTSQAECEVIATGGPLRFDQGFPTFSQTP